MDKDSSPMDVVPLQVIKDLIAGIQALNLHDADLREGRLLIKKLVFFYPIVRRGIITAKIYRARNNSTGKFDNVAELWYPPANYITKYGRLNDIGQPVFYCSDQEAVAISEMRPQAGETLTIVECALNGRSLQLKDLGLLPESPADLLARRKVLKKAENMEKYDLIRELLHREFTQIVRPGEDHRYKMTVSIAYWLMSDPDADGIVYPSIETGQVGINYALKPEAADNYLQPVSAKIIEIHRNLAPIGYEGIIVGCSKRIEPNGTIIW